MIVAEQAVLAALDPADVDGDGDQGAARTHFLTTPDGGTLHVVERGAGLPVVLLHGHGANLGTFGWMADGLAAAECRVVTIDLRGFGSSSAAPTTLDLTGLVDDVVAVLDELDLHDVILVGHSMGGGVALGVAAWRPAVAASRLRGLVLVNSAARGPADTRRNRVRMRALEWEGLERLGRHPRHGLALARWNFGDAPSRVQVEAAQAIGLGSPVARRQGLTERLLGTDLSEQLADVRLPVLVLGGSRDRVVAPQESVRLGELLPDARVEILEGAGHMLPIERAREVVERVLAFADELGVGGWGRRRRGAQASGDA